LILPADGHATISAAVKGVPTAQLSLAHPPTAVARAPSFADVAALERARVLPLAAAARRAAPVSIRATPLPAFAIAAGAQPGDYLSMGDYWWPNPATPDGLPYVRRDGESNPANFDAHRQALRTMRHAVAALAAAYLVSDDASDAQRAADWLRVFFLAPASRMNPHLRFAQAIPGVTTGRGIGIIDTLHLCEVALAAQALAGAPGVSADTLAGVRTWFSDYLHWMLTDPRGREEAAAKNNHSVAYYLQIAVFARYVGDQAALDDARRVFLEELLPQQLGPDGSFPRELSRTKPFGYSIFQLDNVALLTEVLTRPGENLWPFALPDGRSIAQAVAFLAPCLEDRERWPFAHDVAHFDDWPIRQPALLLAGYRLGRPDYLALWRRLPADSTNPEIRRNMAVTQPLLWLASPR
jgi:hypothetical protein